MQSGQTITGPGFFRSLLDLVIYIKNVIIAQSFRVPSGSTDWAGRFSHIGGWIVTIMTIVFIGAVIWAVYIRVRIFEVDEELDKNYKGHFIKPTPSLRKSNIRWDAINAHFASGNPNDWRAAILDADSMLEELVTNLGYTGETFGEKLKSINIRDFPTLQSAWEAHKIRNLIAHEGMNYNLTDRQKDIARRHYENVFRDAGLI